MGKNNTLSITLDNTSAVYYPCQFVSGNNKHLSIINFLIKNSNSTSY